MAEKKYYAHSANAKGDWQPLKDHLQNVAALAKKFAEEARPGDAEFAAAAAAGLLHDLGKYSLRFQQRLNDNRVSAIEHWVPGSAILLKKMQMLYSAYSAFAHHVGLLNASEMHKTISAPQTTEIPETLEQLERLFCQEFVKFPVAIKLAEELNDTQRTLITRTLFSCLVDADFLDTEQHFEPEETDFRRKNAGKFLPKMWLPILEKRICKLSSSRSPANKARHIIFESCVAAANNKPGLFSLTAPTGGGKTLSNLAFAINHAVKNPNFRRLIVVLPYTTIIDQTARVYREIVGLDNLLEHHSAKDSEKDSDAEKRYQLAAENWDAPVIITTQVQFFESLFSNKPSACRKLHQIPNSIIIFDEVQTLTGYLLRPLLNMVNELCQNMGCTAVLSTATPNSLGTAGSKLSIPAWNPKEIIGDPSSLSRDMRRVNISMPENYSTPTPLSEIAAEMSRHKQALCIVNRKDDAEDLYRLLPETGRYHLSTRMCPIHRMDILAVVKNLLDSGEICRLSATQCVEAGVDFDFPAVWRSLGPLDSILQAAGRCNREGHRKAADSTVKVFVSERQPPVGCYGVASQVTPVFQQLFHNDDILDPEIISKYFHMLLDRISVDKVRLKDGRESSIKELGSSPK